MLFLFNLKIAAISPADINFDESVSTLRYGIKYKNTCLRKALWDNKNKMS